LAGFFVAVASLFYFPYIFLLLFIWISLMIFKSFSEREWLVPIFGLITPYLFLFVYLFLTDDVDFLFIPLKNNFSLEFSFNSLSLEYIIFYNFLALLIFISSVSVIRKITSKKIKIRKYLYANLWLFIIGIAMMMFLLNVSYEILYLIAIPSSFLITEYLYEIRKNIYGNILLLLMLGSIIFIQLSNYMF
jgi:hypothetical protein